MNTGVWRGLVTAPRTYLCVGAALITAARASHIVVDMLTSAPSGYVADTADTCGPVGSNTGIGLW